MNKEKNNVKEGMTVGKSKSDKDEYPSSTWTKEEREISKKLYGCEVLYEKCSQQELRNPEVPNDTYIISYYQNETLFHDLVRGRKVKIFDMYYDKFGPGSVKKIDFSYGKLNPRLWGYQAPKSKKRK